MPFLLGERWGRVEVYTGIVQYEKIYIVFIHANITLRRRDISFLEKIMVDIFNCLLCYFHSEVGVLGDVIFRLLLYTNYVMNTAELLDIRYHLGFFKRSAPMGTFYTLFFFSGRGF